MPRHKKTDIINYKIYKIASLDPNVKEIYVGSTVDLKQRKALHKHSCNNENSNRHHLKVYQYIRDNGGWENFKFYVLEELKCNEYQAELREEYWRKEVNATLNGKMCRFDGDRKEYQKGYRDNNKGYLQEYFKSDKGKNSQKRYKQSEKGIFIENKNKTINRLRNGRNVKHETLEKYGIKREDYLS